MSGKATQLEKSLNNPDYGLYSIEALYLNSQIKGAIMKLRLKPHALTKKSLSATEKNVLPKQN